MSDFDEYRNELHERRSALLDAMLDDVPFDGWRETALERGAVRLDLDLGDARLAFPGGLAEVASFWSRRSDARMLHALANMSLDEMRIRDRVAAAVRARIEVNLSRREAVSRLMGWFALPMNAPVAMKNMARTVNEMWYAAGDTSADWNYYTKRGLLMPVYSTTVLYWLADEADENGEFPATWAYLDRRIDDVLKTFGAPRKMRARLDGLLSGIGFGGERRRA